MSATLSCPVCWESLDATPVRCPDCKTAYHARCLRLVGPCPVPGCTAADTALAARAHSWPEPSRTRGTPERYRETVARLRANAPMVVPLVALQMLSMGWLVLGRGDLGAMLAYQLFSLLAMVWTTTLAARPADRPRSAVEMVVTPLARLPRLGWAFARLYFITAFPIGVAMAFTNSTLALAGGAAWFMYCMFRLHLTPLFAMLPSDLGGDPITESLRITGRTPGLLVRGHLGLWLVLGPLQLLILALSSMFLSGGMFAALMFVLPALGLAMQAFATTFTMVLVEDCKRALPAAQPASADA